MPLQAREQHPTAAAPIFTKLPAVGHEMEVTAVWHRGMACCREGVTASVLAWLSLPTPLRGDTGKAMLLPPRVALTVGVCVQRPAVPRIHTGAQLLISCWEQLSTALSSWSLCNPRSLQGFPMLRLPMLAGQAGAQQGPSAGPRQGVSWQQQPAACLGNVCIQVHAPSSVLPASPMVVPLRGSFLLIVSFLPHAQQHNLLPALQGYASEAPGTQAGNSSLQSDGAGASFQP